MNPPDTSSRPHEFRLTIGGRLALPAHHYSATIAALAVVMMVGASWLVCYWAGGSRSVAPHLFYVPIVLAAIRLGQTGALVTAVAAGIAAGPLLPLDVETSTAQDPLNWLLRAGAFLVIGGLVAFFVHHSRGEIGNDLTRAAVRRDLRRALESRHLHVVYQPIIDLRSGETVGAEALARWSDPERGSLPPAEFVPAAEDAGVASLISDFVLGEVGRQLGTWRSEGLLSRDEGFKMAVNVSGSELHDDRLENRVRALLVHERFPAHWLHLEVTETALIDNLESAVASLNRLRGLGARISIDDFGTGESTLRYLHRFPVDTLKIDRSFVGPLVDDDRGRIIVGCVVDLARSMNLQTVAEGVETAEHAELLRSIGCDLAQGYHFARPVDPLTFARRLAEERRDACR